MEEEEQEKKKRPDHNSLTEKRLRLRVLKRERRNQATNQRHPGLFSTGHKQSDVTLISSDTDPFVIYITS